MNDQLENPKTVATLEPVPIAFKRESENHRVPIKVEKAIEAEPRRLPKPQPAPIRTAFDDNDDDQDDTFVGRHKAKLGIAVVLLIGGLMTYFIKNSGDAAPRRAPERVVMIQMPPPLPPPPPPPPPPKIEPPPKMEEKMIEQAPVEDEPKPDPKPMDEPPPALGTGIKGDGPPDGFGLSGNGNGGRIGGNGLGNGRRGGPFDAFAGSVQSRVRSAISNHRKTRAARIPGSELRVWVDSTGRVTRVKVSPPTGDAAIDAALQGEVLPGMQLEPPPSGMPMPVVMRLTARRPN